MSARAVDVKSDLLFRILRLEVEQLRHHEVGDLVVDRGADEDDALLEEPRVDVEGPLAAARVLHHHRHEIPGRPLSLPHIPHNVILDRPSAGSVKSLNLLPRGGAPGLSAGEAAKRSSGVRSGSSSAPPPGPSARRPW